MGIALFVVFFARTKITSFGFFGWLATCLAITAANYGGRRALLWLAVVFLINTLFFAWYHGMHDRVPALPASATFPVAMVLGRVSY